MIYRIYLFAIVKVFILLVTVFDADGSSVSVNKNCIPTGEVITVSFRDVTGTGVWIGLYKRNLITDFSNLPSFSEDSLSSWVLSCGDTIDCLGWPSNGSVHFPTDGLDDSEYVVVVSGDRASLNAQAHSDTFRIDTNCLNTAISPTTADRWIPPGPNDQRSPCPFLNVIANHGLVNRNGTFIDVIDMAEKLEAVFNLDAQFLIDGPIKLSIDCDQTYEDENGIVRIDLDVLFDGQCEEHEASMTRPDSFFGFDKSKKLDDSLLNNLMRMNPYSDNLTIDDVMQYQTQRIMESRLMNPETEFREHDIETMGAQGLFLFLVGDDPTLTTIEKGRLYSFLLMERLPHDFVPGAIRDTPFNPMDESDLVASMLMRNREHVESMMDVPMDQISEHFHEHDN